MAGCVCGMEDAWMERNQSVLVMRRSQGEGKEKKGELRMERGIFKDDHLFLATDPLWYPDPSHMRRLRKKEMAVLGTLQGSHRGTQGSTVLPEVVIPTSPFYYIQTHHLTCSPEDPSGDYHSCLLDEETKTQGTNDEDENKRRKEDSNWGL